MDKHYGRYTKMNKAWAILNESSLVEDPDLGACYYYIMWLGREDSEVDPTVTDLEGWWPGDCWVSGLDNYNGWCITKIRYRGVGKEISGNIIFLKCKRDHVIPFWCLQPSWGLSSVTLFTLCLYLLSSFLPYCIKLAIYLPIFLASWDPVTFQ